MAEIKLTKNGREVATAPKVTASFNMKPDPGTLEGIEELGLWYFSKISMSPTAMFEHLAGTALKAFLDGCSLSDSEVEGDVGPLRYVHGRSEVMKGKHDVSAVWLARPTAKPWMSEVQWLSYLPEIFKQAMKNLNLSEKRA